MSKKVAFPVMSTTITGVLFIVGILLVTLRAFLATPGFITDASTATILSGLLGFLAIFIMAWALICLSLHPAIDDKFRTLFVVATVLLLMSVLATNFDVVIGLGKLVGW